MTLRQTTQDLIARVEAFSGFPVDVVSESSIDGPAALRLARGETARHTIFWSPEQAGLPDYHVSLQCVMILRHFSYPEGERMDLTGSRTGRESIRGQLDEMARRGKLPALGDEQMRQFTEQLLRGLGTQLRSMPIELRANTWLSKEYPDLREAQEVAARKQLVFNARSLSTRESIPSKIYRASIAMNAATALYWAELLGDDALTAPYRKAGYMMDGRGLMRIYYSIDEAATLDRDLIDAWGRAVKIQPWFTWKPYEQPAMAGDPA